MWLCAAVGSLGLMVGSGLLRALNFTLLQRGYGLVLFALARAPVSAVAPARETRGGG